MCCISINLHKRSISRYTSGSKVGKGTVKVAILRAYLLSGIQLNDRKCFNPLWTTETMDLAQKIMARVQEELELSHHEHEADKWHRGASGNKWHKKNLPQYLQAPSHPSQVSL